MTISKKLSYKNLEIKLEEFKDARGGFLKIFNFYNNFNIKQINISRNKKMGDYKRNPFSKKNL